ncbi:hypothetical protein D3C79_718960 [compost metagenome]
MDRSTPISDRRCKTARLASASCIAVVSVISSVRRLAGKPFSRRARATLSTRPAWQNWIADKLTAMRQFSYP